MINTVTLNPALDYFVETEQLALGKTNLSSYSYLQAGGKGVNVAIVAKNLGLLSRATGFLGGSTGEVIAQELVAREVEDRFVRVDAPTRINIKLKENDLFDENSDDPEDEPGDYRSCRETEINASGEEMSPESLQLLYDKTENFGDGEFLVLSGNIPPSLDASTYAALMERFAHKNFTTVVDASGEALRHTLALQPFLIKTNWTELKDFFGTNFDKADDPVNACREIQRMGARNVLYSFGREGALLLTEDGKFHIQSAPRGYFVASSGAGDAMVAGFLAGHIIYNDPREALRLAVAAGSATAFSYGLAEGERIRDLYQLLQGNRSK